MWSFQPLRRLLPLLLLSTLPVRVLAGDLLSSAGYSMCLDDPNIQVERLNVTYNRDSRLITFDVAGKSTVELKVTVDLVVTAYGKEVYTRSFDPCDVHDINMPQICPVPATTFASKGQEIIPEKYASQIPSIAFSIPDLDGLVQLKLVNDQGVTIACVQSAITNGNTFNMPAVSYAAAGVAAGAFAVSAAGAIAAGGHPGASTTTPSFGATMGWFQGLATSGMLSVAYPKIYQTFTTNFAFSTGLVPWAGLQTSIDNFRQATGGNLTDASYRYLKNNATLVFADKTRNTSLSTRSLLRRDATVSVNGTVYGNSTNNATAAEPTKSEHFVHGIEAYVEQLSIPKANTFMTVLLVWACVVAFIIVAILLGKLILELIALSGSAPKSMESWRKRYWWRMAKALTNLVLLLYGVWTLYCIYQFTNGDSWAAKTLAGVTLALFTGILLGFTYKIYSKAHEYKRIEGDSKGLFEKKEVWIRYSLFYESYKRSYWWVFVPVIVYMFARGCVIAGLNGNGLVQVSTQLFVEGLMLVFLLWTRPFERKSSQWINITIQVVRFLSVGCVLVFVEELNISQTTKTITGVILIVVQCCLTGVLAILIAVNAIIGCIKENPHRRQRKLAEKQALERDLEDLDPGHGRRASLAMDGADAHAAYANQPLPPYRQNPMMPPASSYYEKKGPLISATAFSDTSPSTSPANQSVLSASPPSHGPLLSLYPSTTPPGRHVRRDSPDDEDSTPLVSHAAGPGRTRDESAHSRRSLDSTAEDSTVAPPRSPWERPARLPSLVPNYAAPGRDATLPDLGKKDSPSPGAGMAF
jgi:hypothetical protein